MTSPHLAELLAYAQQHAESDELRQGDFFSAYFENTDPEEIKARGPAYLFALASAHWQLLDTPSEEQFPKIRVFNPSLEEDGFVSPNTVVQIVNDDMPFLVDSVTVAINRSGRTAHWIVHPLMNITRDTSEGIATVGRVAADTTNTHAKPVTSLILVECDRILSVYDQQNLTESLVTVLKDVKDAVDDWDAMLARMQSLALVSEKFLAGDQKHQEGIIFLRWLTDHHFTFLGARDYDLKRHGNQLSLVAIQDSGLGILRGKAKTNETTLPPELVALIDSKETVLVTKAMTRATVHRPGWLDYIAVKRFNDAGEVIGESRFLGLFTSTAYSASVNDIPQVRQRAAIVMRDSGVVPDSHAAKALQSILDDYPRDELFQIDTATLLEHAIGILRLQERQRVRVFLRRDPFGRFTSAQVFVPRDRYNTELRVKISGELMSELDGQSIEFTPMLTDSPQARIHYLIRAKTDAPTNIDTAALEARITKLTERWEDDCSNALLQTHGETRGLNLSKRFANAFSTSYREDFFPAEGAEDADILAKLSHVAPLAVRLYRPMGAVDGLFRFKIFNLAKVALSDSLPVLERMGARVLDEHPYHVSDGESQLWIHDLGLQLPNTTDLGLVKARFEELFMQAWRGEVESDDLNRLVLNTTLDARSIAVLRACSRYFKQLGFAFSQNYIEAALNKNNSITELIAELFGARFKPDFVGDREAAQKQIRERLEIAMEAVESLDEDRILRQFIATVMACLRTNLWQTCSSGELKSYMSFKLNPREIPGVPEPKPLFEIWVYSPRVEGVHLRGGKVARGGLRWSDRREDFRTEILGLVKAQQVKNTVIVPVGSKGGFVLKKAPAMSDREAYQAEGIACYKTFLSGLLDITDNIVKGHIVPPPQVIRHDADDPYLVVAADKGTATFSDIANGVSADYGFWLDDAFASGGSVGYDHKKMGITARGAWESVKRHFRSFDHNTQTTPFTVAGIGDMSGDVFGNGMLLSEQIALVLAFDHRHIVIDPAPPIAAAFAERQRMFNLPRSSWDDYDRSLISKGGGIYPRNSKSIPLSPEARAVLNIDNTEIAPLELLKAILQAPVDLLYNGGIGTYVKATFETHAQVGDKASDAYRVNGNELRCKVFAEGGNLGSTQNGRIEFAQKGGRIYTDAIDNSAGVDCSDHEVNIKILLGGIVEAGILTLDERNELLASMTDEVGHLVLTDNYYQSQALDIACHRPLYVLDGQQRLMQSLERQGRLNRAIEYLPTDEEIAHRKAHGQGLTAPENAVVLAYAKMAVFDELVASNLPDDPFFSRALKAYFPQILSEKFTEQISKHPLKREIVATFITNTVVNRTGATFVNFVATEAAASAADVIRAFTLAREIFDLEALWDQIDALDYRVDSKLQLDLLCKLTAIAQRASRWMLRARTENADLPTLIRRYQPSARELRQHLADWLPAAAYANMQQAGAKLAQAGVEESLAHNLAALEFIFPALDLVDLAQATKNPLETTARTYFGVDAALGLTGWREQIKRLPTDTLWQTQARSSARDDVYSIASQVTKGLLARQESQATWQQQHANTISRLNQLLSTIATQGADLAPVSVALRELRNLA
ncbi:MAG: NAD-glutamate dehydrogenase [Undibacterium sp.]|nr:NAD-glutamate dehydrogenase [Undibacterium sp.]